MFLQGRLVPALSAYGGLAGHGGVVVLNLTEKHIASRSECFAHVLAGRRSNGTVLTELDVVQLSM